MASATATSHGHDAGHGHDDGLSEIELKNLHGTYQSSTEAKAQGGVQAAAEQEPAVLIQAARSGAEGSAASSR